MKTERRGMILLMVLCMTMLLGCGNEQQVAAFSAEATGPTVQEVSFTRDGMNIAGELYLPGTGNAPYPTVILSHGFGGSMSNTRAYAEKFAENGIAAVIFDFIGGGYGGRSDGDMKQMSVLTEAADLTRVLQDVIALPETDEDGIFLFSESQGGFVSSYVAAKQREMVRGLICLYPAYVLQDDARERVASPGYSADHVSVMGISLGEIYDRDALSFDIYDVIPEFDKDVLLIHGTADSIVPISYSERAETTFPSAELKQIDGAGHGFYGADQTTAAAWAVEFIKNVIAGNTTSAAGFSDVDASAWYADAVGYVSEKGLMVGTGDDSFSPDATFTRAQVATVLYRMAGEPEVSGEDGFSDTDVGQWYSDAVLWCTREGVIEGYGGGLFGTTDPVTQEQLLTLFYRFIDEPTSTGTDRNGVSDYAQSAVRWALAAGVASESAGYSFAPKSAATRATVAVMLANFDRLRTGIVDTTMADTLQLKVNDTSLTVQWEDNESVDALKELVKDAPLTIQMSMYGGFEQVGSLGTSLPRNDIQTNTSAGDIVLYSGNNIVVFYGSNSWAYTRLGKIVGLSNQELRELLGSGDVTVTLSLGE